MRYKPSKKQQSKCIYSSDFTSFSKCKCVVQLPASLINSNVYFAAVLHLAYCFQEAGLGAGLNGLVWTV